MKKLSTCIVARSAAGKEHQTVSPVTRNLKTSGHKFLTFLMAFAILFSIIPVNIAVAETPITYYTPTPDTHTLVSGRVYCSGNNASGNGSGSISFLGGASVTGLYTSPNVTTPTTITGTGTSYSGQIWYNTQADADNMTNGCKDPIVEVSVTYGSLNNSWWSYSPFAGARQYEYGFRLSSVSATYTIRNGTTNAVWMTWTSNWSQISASAGASSSTSTVMNGQNVTNAIGDPTTLTLYRRSYSVPGTPVGPIISAAPPLTRTLGTPVGGASTWIENITATWGWTTANTIPTQGSITDNTLAGGTDTDLSTAGTTWDRVGWKSHNYTVKDSTNDGTYTYVNRNIIVQSATPPTLSIAYAAGAVDPINMTPLTGPYTGGWTNQPLEITITSNDPGTYDFMLRRNGSNTAYFSSVTGPNSFVISNYLVQSGSVAGDDLSAILLGTGDHTIILSPESASQTVKIDTTNPAPDAVYDPTLSTFADNSTDALSGVVSSLSKIALVLNGSAAPLDAAYQTFAALNALITPAGWYDVYVWAWDAAGNDFKSSVISNMQILSSYYPIITGELASGASIGSAHPSDTWINQDVNVIATYDSNEPGYYAAIYNGTTQVAKSATINAPANITYTAETTGINLNARLVDILDTASSQNSPVYTVKIDKTKPVSALTYNAGTPDYGFTDASTDTNSMVANSGVDSTKTKVAIVPAGAPQPAAGVYILISDVLAEIPSTGHYDVWVIATDNASNEGDPVKGLSSINRALTDSIDAKDFAWDIASGSAALTGPVAVMLAHVSGNVYGSGTAYNTSDFLINAAELANIHTAINAGQKGTVWPLTFSTPAGPSQASTTVNVKLFDNGPGSGIDTPNLPNPPGPLSHELIYANDFEWGISSGSLGTDMTKFLSRVAAYDIYGDPIVLSLINVNATELALINSAIVANDVGSKWLLTFNTPDLTETAVYVTLYDSGPVTPPGPGNESIVANNFVWGISTGSLNDTIAKQLSGVIATGADGIPMNVAANVTANPADIVAINAAIALNQVGAVLPLTFTTDGSTGTSSYTVIYVTLYDKGPITPPVSGDEYIAANDFVWGISTGSLNDTISKQLSGVFATGMSGVPMNVTNNVSVNPADLAAINTAIASNQAGSVFTLNFTTDGSSGGTPSTVMINVTLYDNGPVAPPGPTDEYIAANDFAWGISTGSLSVAAAKQVSGVFAVGMNGIPMNVTNHVIADTTDLAVINTAITANRVGDVFTLNFTTDGSSGGTPSTVMVNVTLYNNGPVTPPGFGDEYIAANDFVWGISTGSLNGTMSRQLSGVFAVGANGVPMNVTNHVVVDTTHLAAINAAIAANQIGVVLPLAFTTDGSSGGTPSTVTVNVTLYDNGPITPPGPGIEYIAANDFAWGISTGSLSDAVAKQISGVFAVGMNGVPMNVTNHVIVDATDLAAINAAIVANQAGDVFTLNFTTDGSSSGTPATVMVNVTLYNSGPVTPPGPGDEYIAANDFAWGISTGSLSDAAAKQVSGVFAVGMNGVPMNVTNNVSVDAADLAAINAAIAANQVGDVFTLNFTTDGSSGGTSSTVMVNVTLYNKGPVTPPGPGDEYIAANDFAWGISTGSLNDTMSKQLSGVFAVGANGVPMNVTNHVIVSLADLSLINAGQAGDVLPLTFTTDGSSGGTPSTVTVNVTLYNNGPVTPPGPGDEYIAANDFAWGISTGALNSAVAKQISGVFATGMNGVPMNVTNHVIVDSMATELAAINAGQAGDVFTLTFETDGSSGGTPSAVTVNVTLYDNGPVTPPAPGDEYIAANNFPWGINTGPLTDVVAKQLSGVIAIDANGLPMSVANNVTADPAATELTAINDAIIAGQKGTSWNLTFETDGSTGNASTVTIRVTLYDYGPPAPPGPMDEFIAANDFNWPAAKGNLTDTDAKQLSGVVAIGMNGLKMNLSNNVTADPTMTELNDIDTAVAARQYGSVWPLTFTTDGSSGGTPDSVTVNVTITGSNSGSGTGNATIIPPQQSGNQSPMVGLPQTSGENRTPEEPAKGMEQEHDVGTYSLLAVLLLILSLLVALGSLPGIYKTEQLKKGSKITTEIERSILIFCALVIIAAVVLIAAFFVLYTLSGNMIYYNLKYDAILVAIFVVEVVFFSQGYKKLKKFM